VPYETQARCSADFLVGVDDFEAFPDAQGDVGATIRDTNPANPCHPSSSHQQQIESETQAEPARRRRGGLLIGSA
jgi:hypothetical protein